MFLKRHGTSLERSDKLIMDQESGAVSPYLPSWNEPSLNPARARK